MPESTDESKLRKSMLAMSAAELDRTRIDILMAAVVDLQSRVKSLEMTANKTHGRQSEDNNA